MADLRKAPFARMAFAVEENEAATPVGKGRDGGFGVAEEASGPGELIEEARRGRRQRGSGEGSCVGGPGYSPKADREPMHG